jgi:hypothetical protein
MLFGSAALFAIFLAGGTFSSARPSPCPWSPSARCARPLAAPVPALDLRQIASPSASLQSTTDLLRRNMPVEVKSVKVCGASGLGVFVPIFDDVSVGASATAFKTGPHERALQVVAGVRVKF